MAPDGHTARSGPFSSLERALVEWCADAREHPLDRITGIVPSNLLARRIESVLTPDEGAIMNVRLLTFLDLALSILDLEQGGPPAVLQEPDKLVLLRRVLRDHPDPLWRESRHEEGFLAGVAAALGDLREAGAHPEAAHLATLCDLWNERLAEESLLDADCVVRAAACVPGEILRHALSGPVFLYGFYDFSPGQRALVSAMSAACPLSLFLPEVPGADGEYAGPTTEWVGGEIARVVPLEDPPGTPGDRQEDRLRVLAAPGPGREADAVAEALLRERETGTPWEEMAVLLYDAASFLRPLARALEIRGIPFVDRFPRPLSAEPHAAAVSALLACVEDGFPWQALLQVITSPWFRAGPQVASEWWGQILLQAGVAGGGTDGRLAWTEGMERLLQTLEAEARKEASPGTATTRLAEARLLASTLSNLFEAVGALPGEAAPDELSHALLAFVNAWLPAPEPEREPGPADVRAAVERIFRQGGGRGAGTPPRKLGSLIGDLRLWIANTSFRDAAPAVAGVRLLDVMEARGLSFEVVAVPGLVEGRFPRGLRQDPFLPDAVRASLGIPTRRHRNLEDRLLFRLSASAARRRLILSWQRTDASGRRCAPSPVLREACRDLFPGGDLPIARVRRRLSEAGVWQDLPVTPLPHGDRSDGDVAPSRLLRLTELHAALHSRRAPGHEDLTDERLLRCLRSAESRRGPRLSEWDGVLSEAAAGDLSGPLSPTRFEDYALCPYKYFCRHLLGLEPVLSEPMPEELSPLDRGSLTHDALEATYAVLAREGLLPVGPERWEPARRIAEAETERILSVLWARLPTLPPLLRERERRRALRNVRAVLDWESTHTEEWVHHLSEASFGLAEGDPSLVLTLPGGDTLSIRGRIDRVDRHTCEPRARIVDYKTGNPPQGKVVKIREQMRFQLPLYGFAVEDLQMAGEGTTVEDRLYLYLTDGEWTECRLESMDREELLSILRDLREGIAGAAFFVAPGDHCRWCDFDQACRRRPMRRAQRKHDTDPAAAPWRAARGMEVDP